MSANEPTSFIILVGGYGNIGDALIRRRSLAWIRGTGPVVAYVGNAPDHWLEQMGITSRDAVYGARQALLWVRRLVLSRGPKVLIFDPGEVLLSRRQAPKELGFLGLTILARLVGAKVIRNPRAVREPAEPTIFIHRIACRASNLVLWRDRKSFELMKSGSLVPDIGFSEPLVQGATPDQRTYLTISMRGLRAYPSEEWFEGIRRYASSRDLRIAVLSQVREDETRSYQIANRLGAEMFEWGQKDDLEQEALVRSIYEKSSLVVSDRMHVLVFAAISGAIPVEIAPNPVAKISEHFGLIGITGISFDSSGKTAPEVEAFLASTESVGTTLTEDIRAAQVRLETTQFEVRRTVSS